MHSSCSCAEQICVLSQGCDLELSNLVCLFFISSCFHPSSNSLPLHPSLPSGCRRNLSPSVLQKCLGTTAEQQTLCLGEVEPCLVKYACVFGYSVLAKVGISTMGFV